MTNLERMQHLVLDEAHLLLDKYGKQIRTLMSSYSNLLRINDSLPVAQIVAHSVSWKKRRVSELVLSLYEKLI